MPNITSNTPLDEDTRLILQQTAANDWSAFDMFYSKYRPVVTDYLASLIGYKDSLQDLVQEVFFRFCQQRKQLPVDLNPKTYLIGIAKNVLREEQRRRRRIPITDVEDLAVLEDQLVHKNQDNQEKPDPVSLAKTIEQAKSKLPPVLQEALKLVYGEGLQVAEAAKQAGCTYNQMHWRVDQAKSQLKQLMKKKDKKSSV